MSKVLLEIVALKQKIKIKQPQTHISKGLTKEILSVVYLTALAVNPELVNKSPRLNATGAVSGVITTPIASSSKTYKCSAYLLTHCTVVQCCK